MSTVLTPGVYTQLMPSLRQPIFPVGTNTACFIGIVQDAIWVPVANSDYDPLLARDIDLVKKLLSDARNLGGPALRKATDRLADKLAAEERNVTDAKNDLDQAETMLADREAALETARKSEDPEVRATLRQLGSDRRQAQTVRDEARAKSDNAARARDEVANELAAANAASGAPAEGAAVAATVATPAEAATAATPTTAPVAAQPTTAGTATTTGAPGGGAPASFEKEDFDYGDVDPPDDYQGASPLRPYFFEKREVATAPLVAALCTNMTEYFDQFGRFSGYAPSAADADKPLNPGHHMLTHAVNGFFLNGGSRCFVVRIASVDDIETALDVIESLDEVALLAAPGLPKMPKVWGQLQDYCEPDEHANVFAILDSGLVLNDTTAKTPGTSNMLAVKRLDFIGEAEPLLPRKSPKAAFYAPGIRVFCPAKSLQDRDPARGVGSDDAGLTYVCPSGHVAGIYARVDEERGVFKTPANETVRGALGLKYDISKAKQGLLNPQGVNCIRYLNGAITVWGGRTIGGERNSDLTYISVVRMIGFIRKSLEDGTQWAVFEPNGPKLWSRIAFNITSFLTNVWRDGGLFGLTPQEAFFVRCDAELNPESVREIGQVITEVGVALLKPAEFVIIRISQWSSEDAKA